MYNKQCIFNCYAITSDVNWNLFWGVNDGGAKGRHAKHWTMEGKGLGVCQMWGTEGYADRKYSDILLANLNTFALFGIVLLKFWGQKDTLALHINIFLFLGWDDDPVTYCCATAAMKCKLRREAILNLNGEENQICLFGVCLLMT